MNKLVNMKHKGIYPLPYKFPFRETYNTFSYLKRYEFYLEKDIATYCSYSWNNKDTNEVHWHPWYYREAHDTVIGYADNLKEAKDIIKNHYENNEDKFIKKHIINT
jgi:hypothetical protein